MTAPSCICSALTKAQNKSLLTANEKLLAENEKLKVENAAGRVENGALLTANQKLLTENQRLKLEVGTFRLLISQMRLLRERELSESSETGSEGEEEDADSSSDKQRNNSVANSRSEGDEEDVDPKSGAPPTPETVSDSSWDEDDDKLSSLESIVTDSDSDIEMETDDRQDEIDEVDEADDDLESPDGDNEENRDERDDSLWKRKCLWKCAKCLKDTCGTRSDRLKHIAVHNSFKIRCPVDGCNVFLGFTTSKRLHLQRTHQIELGQLSQTQKRQLKIEQARYYKKSKEQEREFFPKENIGEVLKLANDTCKKCNTKVVSYPGQFQHVAAHLKLRIKCPLPECKSAVANWYSHLRGVHNLKLHELDEGVQELLKKSHMNKIRAVKKAKNKYF